MAPVKVAINGCGRIGRLALRIAWEQPDKFEIVHLNDITPAESVAYLLRYDSVHGTWRSRVKAEAKDKIVITDGDRTQTVVYSDHSNPADIDYSGLGIDLVMECTGCFLTRKTLQPYFDKGIKKVVVSAPVKDADPVLNVVVGCNENLYDASKDHIVTAASCTTNCLAPVIKVMLEKLGIVHGCITTIHNLTNTQVRSGGLRASGPQTLRASGPQSLEVAILARVAGCRP